MKIKLTNNYQQQNKINFNGKLIVEENLSQTGKEFVLESFQQINQLAEKLPYDIYMKEMPKEKHTTPVVFAVKEGIKPKPFVCMILDSIVEDFVLKKNIEATVEEFSKKVDIKKITEEIMQIKERMPLNPKPYAPHKIGTPQKPYIKKIFYKK